MRFLLVDNQKIALMSLKYRLSRYQIEAATFDEEAAALRVFEADPGAFDAVVAKRAMRRIRGDSFAQRIWAIAPEKPITILSGLSDEARLAEEGIETTVCTLSDPAPVPDILLSLESQGLRFPRRWRELGIAKSEASVDSEEAGAARGPRTSHAS